MIAAIILLVSAGRLRAWRLIGTGYLVTLTLLTGVLGYYSAWAPAVVVLVCCLAVAGGILFGPRAVYPLAAFVAIALLVGKYISHEQAMGRTSLEKEIKEKDK